MSDLDARTKQRRALNGDQQERARFMAGCLRTGSLRPQIELAAFIGDPAARQVVPTCDRCCFPKNDDQHACPAYPGTIGQWGAGFYTKSAPIDGVPILPGVLCEPGQDDLLGWHANLRWWLVKIVWEVALVTNELQCECNGEFVDGRKRHSYRCPALERRTFIALDCVENWLEHPTSVLANACYQSAESDHPSARWAQIPAYIVYHRNAGWSLRDNLVTGLTSADQAGCDVRRVVRELLMPKLLVE